MSGFGNGKGFGGGSVAQGIPYNNPSPNPLDEVEYTGDLEVDAKAEIDALAKGFRARAAAEESRYKHAVDGSFWLGVVFNRAKDREKFLEGLKMSKQVYRGQYLDGYQLAQILGIDI